MGELWRKDNKGDARHDMYNIFSHDCGGSISDATRQLDHILMAVSTATA